MSAQTPQVVSQEDETGGLHPHRNSTRGYSRFVVLMKVLLPTIALIVITLVVIWPHLQLQDTRFRLGFSALKTGDDEDPSMINPRYLGTDKDNQTYSVTADLAKNLLSDTKSVELEKPKADIALDDGTWLVVTSDTGHYSRGEEKLKLRGSVNMFHDSGYEFRTEVADLDLSTGVAEGNAAVEGQGPFGFLNAEGFRLVDKGKIIFFTGKSKLTIYPGAGEATRK